MTSNTKSQSAAEELDAPATTIARREVIRSKKVLHAIYEEWYQFIVDTIPAGSEPILEIGSGGGFFKEFLPGVISSDVLPLPHSDLTFDACQHFPFENDSLRTIALVNTFHHLPSCENFLSEAQRCLKVGGVLTMIEPWVTPFSSLVYRYLHHEPFNVATKDWHFKSSGPLSGSNQALPWIVFKRDSEKFQNLFPSLEIESLRKIMPIRYLVSGGFSAPQLVPTATFGMLKKLEEGCAPLRENAALFAVITVRKRASA